MTFREGERYSYLIYFLEAYWHQNSDLLYDHSPSLAAADFAKRETEGFTDGLASDLSDAIRTGVIAEAYADPTYSGTWWRQFDNLLRVAQAQEILIALGSARRRH